MWSCHFFSAHSARPGLALLEELKFPRDAWIADVVYLPLETELVSVARSRSVLWRAVVVCLS